MSAKCNSAPAKVSTMKRLYNEDWRTRERHDKEVTATLRAEGAMDSSGWIRYWSPAVVKALSAQGHTSLDYDVCRCRMFPQ